MASHKERLLFTKDEWSIYKADYVYANNKSYVLAYAHHQGCTESGEYGVQAEPMNCWHTGDLKQRCILCDTEVPAGIQALVVLYQWKV